MGQIVWPKSILDVLFELPERDQDIIFEKVDRLRYFPRMYPVRSKGRFRRHRWFFAGDWLIYYRVVGGTVYIRAIWPARIP